jgi:hypothetical protein
VLLSAQEPPAPLPVDTTSVRAGRLLLHWLLLLLLQCPRLPCRRLHELPAGLLKRVDQAPHPLEPAVLQVPTAASIRAAILDEARARWAADAQPLILRACPPALPASC